MELVYDGFARNGATLEGDAKERYAAIDRRLAELYTAFGNRVLADEEAYVTYLSADQLSGLPDSYVAAAQRGRRAARAARRVRRHQHAVLDGPLPDVLRTSATCARPSGGRTTAGATTPTRTTRTR